MSKSFKDIINQDKPVLVDFFATWCGPCQMQGPILGKVKDIVGESADIIKIDIDKNNALGVQYAIRSVPTLVLFKNGKVLWRKSGVGQQEELTALINQHI
ncbi:MULTISPECIES: thioredoxin [Sphingobacterium]|uniref:thioredoxin n=1 Tax=Sphingobacterium TaxID=28453 RepID=UPI0013DD7252|nr:MULTISPECIES: thioredoxin [unclassified Sphingobacterium]